MRRLVSILPVAGLAIWGWISAEAQSLRLLREVGTSVAYDVSADGQTVVGVADGLPVVWRNGQMEYLPLLSGGQGGAAYAVSANGSVIVGYSATANGRWRAVRWVGNTVYDLGTRGDFSSVATDVSANGQVIVGWASRDSTGGPKDGFRWVNGAIEYLPYISDGVGNSSSTANGMSPNGSVIVGWSTTDSSWQRACKWEGGVVYDIGSDWLDGEAFDVSANGVIVGAMYYTLGYGYAFRRQGETNTQIAPPNSIAYAVTDDGGTVVGWMEESYVSRKAFRWVSGNLRDLNQEFASAIPNGWVLVSAYGISGNGRYIVGAARYGDSFTDVAFLLDTQGTPPPNGDVNGDGCVNNDDLLIVLFEFGGSGQGDANRDGVVNNDDLLIVLFNFGQGC